MIDRRRVAELRKRQTPKVSLEEFLEECLWVGPYVKEICRQVCEDHADTRDPLGLLVAWGQVDKGLGIQGMDAQQLRALLVEVYRQARAHESIVRMRMRTRRNGMSYERAGLDRALSDLLGSLLRLADASPLFREELTTLKTLPAAPDMARPTLRADPPSCGDPAVC